MVCLLLLGEAIRYMTTQMGSYIGKNIYISAILSGSVPFVPPPPGMLPLLKRTCHYSKSFRKNMARASGGANNMHTNGKDPKNY